MRFHGLRFFCSFAPVNGEACPHSSEGNALCDSANPDLGFTCTAGTWVSHACRSCAVSGGQVTCLTP